LETFRLNGFKLNNSRIPRTKLNYTVSQKTSHLWLAII